MNSKLYVYGDQNVAVPAHLHFGKYLLDHLRKFQNSDRIAMINAATKEKLTYKEYAQYAVNIATEFMKLGMGRGDVVALGSEKRNQLGPIVLAVILTGATSTTYSIDSGNYDLQHKISVARPNYFIVSKAFWEKTKKVILASGKIKTLMSLDDEPATALSINSFLNNDVDIETFMPPEVKGQTDVVFVSYSSGTTGLPKGVSLTHLNAILFAQPFNIDLNAIEIYFTLGEWFHNYDTFALYKFLSVGKTLVYTDYVTAETIMESIANYKVNMIMVLPCFVIELYKQYEKNKKYNLDSLKYIYSRASSLQRRTIENTKKAFPWVVEVFQGYGMTECGELCSESRGTKGSRAGSVGMASPGIILKVTDPLTGKTLGPNEKGEIRAKGPILMKGYIGVDPATYLDEEGFLMTGDLGYYDDDKYFYIVDRIKEMLKYRSEKVPPVQLETILELHPEVLEAGVVGKYDEVDGDVPTAFVVPRAGSKVTEEELKDYVADAVPPYMQLAGGVKFISKLPRNPRGKILRRELRNMLNETF